MVDVLDLHELDAYSSVGHPRGLMPFTRARNIEHCKELRIRPVIRTRARLGRRWNFHTEDVVEERQRPVHVLDEGRERAGADDGALAACRRWSRCLSAQTRDTQRPSFQSHHFSSSRVRWCAGVELNVNYQEGAGA
jgi:hypothetical protein